MLGSKSIGAGVFRLDVERFWHLKKIHLVWQYHSNLKGKIFSSSQKRCWWRRRASSPLIHRMIDGGNARQRRSGEELTPIPHGERWAPPNSEHNSLHLLCLMGLSTMTNQCPQRLKSLEQFGKEQYFYRRPMQNASKSVSTF